MTCFAAFPPSVPEMVDFAADISGEECPPFYSTTDQNFSQYAEFR